jgi:hypothetical protein
MQENEREEILDDDPEAQNIPLPGGIREKHGSWHFVRKHKWTKLCRIEEGRVRLYECLTDLVAAEDAVWYGIIQYTKDGMSELSEATQKKYREYALRMLHHFGHYLWVEIRPTHAKQFLKWCKKNKRTTTGNREKSFMSSVAEYAMGEGWTEENPFRGVRRNTERRSTTYVEHEVLVKDLDRAPPELYALMATAYLLTARQTDLRLVTKSQRIKNVAGKEILRYRESKTKKEVDHEITPTVAFALGKAAEHQENAAIRYERAAERLMQLSQKRRAQRSLDRAAEVRAQPYIFLSERGHHWTESGLASALQRFDAGFQFRQLRPKGQTDAQDKATTGHTGQMLERYVRRKQLQAVK